MRLRPQCLLTVTLTLEASIDTMLSDLAAAFGGHGVHSRVALYTSMAPNAETIHGLIADLRDYDGPRFLVDVNGKTRFPARDAAGATVSVHDLWNIPRYTLFESHPLNHLEHLAAAPRQVAYSVVCDSHRAALVQLGIPADRILHVPHAGPPPLPRVADSADRPLPVLFLGNIRALPSTAEWLAELGLTAPEGQAAAEVLEAVRAGEGDSFPQTLAAMGRRGLAPNLVRDAKVATRVEARLNDMRRLETLAALRTVPVEVFGAIDPSLRLPGTLRAHGPVRFAKALSLMDNAKLVLNFTPFRTGAHERVFYGLSRGACVLSDPTSLLAPGAAGEGGVIFPEPGRLDEQVSALLADGPALDRRRAAGREWYGARHTWAHRAADILSMMDRLFFH